MIFLPLLIAFPVERSRSRSLRTDVPSIPPPPDREDWARQHGQKPFVIPMASDVVAAWGVAPQPFQKSIIDKLGSSNLDRFTGQARAAIAGDLSTIDREKAINAQVALDHICERVKTEANLPEQYQVFFNPNDNHFWVYPAGEAICPACKGVKTDALYHPRRCNCI